MRATGTAYLILLDLINLIIYDGVKLWNSSLFSILQPVARKISLITVSLLNTTHTIYILRTLHVTYAGNNFIATHLWPYAVCMSEGITSQIQKNPERSFH